MVTLFLIALAAVCNAAMDTMAHHFDTSVFRKLNREFWNPEQYPSGGRMIPHTKYRVNAWHLSKSAMIVFVCLAGVFFQTVLRYWWMDVVLEGLVWNASFNLFYNRIFRRKDA